jgi:hypothetical protein
MLLYLTLSLTLFAALQATPADDVTQPPATAHVLATVMGRGAQIYRCTATPGEPAALQWKLDGPDATLFDRDTKQKVGTHSAGPTWTWKDGSAITGKVLQKQSSPDAASVSWLLLEAHPANASAGALSDVSYVRRSDTVGGAAPATGCDAQHRDNLLRVPYEATYTFYTGK